jgi:hypothetical protein
VKKVMKQFFIANVRLAMLLMTFFSSAAWASDKAVLNDWFALGSGCRARSDLAGNVEVKMRSDRGPSTEIYVARFFFKNFNLEESNISRDLRQFGRECAIRLNINPPPGKKILALHAQTKFVIRKSQGYALDLLSELKLGPVSLGIDRQKFLVSDVQDYRPHAISLSAGQGLATGLPQLGCGEPKIIGFDYSWIVSDKQAGKQTLPVELADDNSLLIEAVLGDCST